MFGLFDHEVFFNRDHHFVLLTTKHSRNVLMVKLYIVAAVSAPFFATLSKMPGSFWVLFVRHSDEIS